MRTRLDYGKAAPDSVQAMYKLQEFSEGSGLERRLLELMKTRVSQINGCAYCIDIQTQDARALGESEQRLYALSEWRETSYYSERERAALGWAEAVTNIPQIYETDEEYKAARAEFSEEELIKLTVVVNAINRWNWLAVAFRETVGIYKASATTV